ncbi:phosphopantetheine-binding protein [Streptomyces sp. DG2A-72]|uniref:acyltransferase family protein n=1 Tax=Streptomyces sp. DG2A-72 TaxID=3051386 RepID=UPI00265B8702|nr:phosphopantetheine-binding protein [Streptomyces sp. DG2A-72]MDO0936294.1 phosphopantetheine-binding protein [Streptomyces sp. DG2A-72]
MLGYAEHPTDLALAVRPKLSTLLHRHGFSALCAGADGALVVAVAGGSDTDASRARRLVTGEFGLPPRAVAVHVLPELPGLPTGKTDHEAVRRLGGAPTPRSDEQPSDLVQLYAEILDRADVTENSSFVSLGGDSLSYVEMSLTLERELGRLPRDWHTRPIRDLRRPEPAESAPGKGSRRRRTLETGIALRAAAIVMIVGSHIHVFYVKGGAHLLLAVAGYNLARFHLTPSAERRERARHALHSIARIVLPSLAWIALVLPLTDDYGLTNLVLLHSVLGPHDSDTAMHFWFVEALTYILVAAIALLSPRIVDRAERRYLFWDRRLDAWIATSHEVVSSTAGDARFSSVRYPDIEAVSEEQDRILGSLIGRQYEARVADEPQRPIGLLTSDQRRRQRRVTRWHPFVPGRERDPSPSGQLSHRYAPISLPTLYENDYRLIRARAGMNMTQGGFFCVPTDAC